MSEHRADHAKLPIRTRQTHERDGTVEQEETVFCPSRGLSLSVETCLHCHYCNGRTYIGDPGLVCLHPAARRPERPPREVRMPSAAELTPVSEIMTTSVTCVPVDLDGESVAGLLLDRNISAVPVVDAGGRPIGVLSKTDLVRWYHDERDTEPPPIVRGPTATWTVADLMMPMAFTLAEQAPIAFAAELMAVEDVHHVPIVSGDGRVVGIVSALDVVRWLAHHSWRSP